MTLTTLGMTVNGDINLNGIGLVRVTLRDGAGALVGGASVTVTSSSPFAALLSGVTASDGGAAVFPSVLAGTITARATHPTSGLHGETHGPAHAGRNAGPVDHACSPPGASRASSSAAKAEWPPASP